MEQDATPIEREVSSHEVAHRPSWTKILATIVLCGVIALVLSFSWKVFAYYQEIKNGTLDPNLGTFSSTTISADRLQLLAQSAPGSGMLATADDPSLGIADAAVTIVAFADFGCPYSQEESYILRAITKAFPEDVRVIYRDFPLIELHPGADLAAQAAECASEQGKFGEMYDELYRNPPEFTAEDLEATALSLGLDGNVYKKCMASGYYQEEVAQDIADGVAAGVTGTPTLFINGIKVEGAMPYGVLTQVVTAMVP